MAIRHAIDIQKDIINQETWDKFLTENVNDDQVLRYAEELGYELGLIFKEDKDPLFERLIDVAKKV